LKFFDKTKKQKHKNKQFSPHKQIRKSRLHVEKIGKIIQNTANKQKNTQLSQKN